MDKLVEKYIYDKEKENIKEEEIRKRKFLISQGLCEKVYIDKSEVDDPDDYLSEYANGEIRYYKLVPVEVSDEEYTRLVNLSQTNHSEGEGNATGTLLVVAAIIIYIVGFILGLVFGNVEVTKGYLYTYTETEFSFGIAVLYWIGAFLSGSLFLGIAEIIKLLQNVKNKK